LFRACSPSANSSRRCQRPRGHIVDPNSSPAHEQPTVARLEALYGARIPVREPALYADAPQASPVSNAHARSRLGWRPATRWSGSSLVTTPAA
jgi:hypothetical protein